MRKLTAELKKIIQDKERKLGEGHERIVFAIDSKYVVKKSHFYNTSNQEQMELEVKVYELFKKYYPEFTKEFICPIAFTGKMNKNLYVIAERAIQSPCEEYSRWRKIMRDKYGLYTDTNIIFDEKEDRFRIVKEILESEKFRLIPLNEKGEIKQSTCKREYFYYSNEEILETDNGELIKELLTGTKLEKEIRSFENMARQLEAKMNLKGFMNIGGDIYGKNVGIHDGKPKIIDLGCFELYRLKNKIREEFNIPMEQEI